MIRVMIIRKFQTIPVRQIRKFDKAPNKPLGLFSPIDLWLAGHQRNTDADAVQSVLWAWALGDFAT